MKRISKSLFATLTAMVVMSAGTTLLASNPEEAPCPGTQNSYGVQPAQRIICIELGPIIIIIGDAQLAGISNGGGDVDITDVTPALATNVHRAAFIPTRIDATSTFDETGTITTRLDRNRTPQTSSIQGNNIGRDFPATENIYFYALGEKDGVVYESVTEVHLVSTNVNSFPRHQNERFQLAEPVDFRDPATGEVAFTMTSLNSTFN